MNNMRKSIALCWQADDRHGQQLTRWHQDCLLQGLVLQENRLQEIGKLNTGLRTLTGSGRKQAARQKESALPVEPAIESFVAARHDQIVVVAEDVTLAFCLQARHKGFTLFDQTAQGLVNAFFVGLDVDDR